MQDIFVEDLCDRGRLHRRKAIARRGAADGDLERAAGNMVLKQ